MFTLKKFCFEAIKGLIETTCNDNYDTPKQVLFAAEAKRDGDDLVFENTEDFEAFNNLCHYMAKVTAAGLDRCSERIYSMKYGQEQLSLIMRATLITKHFQTVASYMNNNAEPIVREIAASN